MAQRLEKFICPICQSKFTLDQISHEADMQALAGLAAKLGRAWSPAWEYLDCFRREQWSSVRLKKRIRLLSEILKLWQSCEFLYQGKRYRTRQESVLKGMETVNNAEKFGFNNHNYLKRILLADAERVSAEGMTAKEEADRHKAQNTGRKDEKKGITAEEYKQKHGIESLADNIGKSME